MYKGSRPFNNNFKTKVLIQICRDTSKRSKAGGYVSFLHPYFSNNCPGILHRRMLSLERLRGGSKYHEIATVIIILDYVKYFRHPLDGAAEEWSKCLRLQRRKEGKYKFKHTQFRRIYITMASTNEFGPDSGGRVKGVTVVKPIVYGNVARYFGKKREEDGHTHQWTVYVKPYNNEDMSTYVKKVHFKLHESYNNPNRIVTKPPYELTETGWGEFEIVIKIYFHDPNERPVTIYHILKLFQSTPEIQLGKKNLVSEFYEEIVFQDPTALMQHLLSSSRPITLGVSRHNTDFEALKESTMKDILEARNKIRLEVIDLKEKLTLAKETIAKFKEEIAKISKAGGSLSVA